MNSNNFIFQKQFKVTLKLNIVFRPKISGLTFSSYYILKFPLIRESPRESETKKVDQNTNFVTFSKCQNGFLFTSKSY